MTGKICLPICQSNLIFYYRVGIVLELTLPEFVLIDSQLLFLLVEELAVEFLAISPKLEGFVNTNIMELEEEVEQVARQKHKIEKVKNLPSYMLLRRGLTAKTPHSGGGVITKRYTHRNRCP